MTTFIMPALPGFVSCRFWLETNTQEFVSPLTKDTEVLELDGAKWNATFTLPPMNRQQAAPWQAFLVGLKGRANSFYGYDPDARTPRGAATGTPLVNGAGQTGNTLAIDGCTANVLGWLRAGDYFQFGTEMKMLTQDANTNGSGQTTLTFEPPTRTSPADNAPITVTNCVVVMRLTDDGQAAWQSGNRLGVYEGLTFSAVEDY